MSVAGERGRLHWNSVAQAWHLYASPLRPCAEDLAAFRRFAEAYSPAPSPSAALILGVTPEIATMAWPPGTVVTGADRSAEMVRHVWPGDLPGIRQAQCVDWFSLPAPQRPYDLVIGDGSINTLGFPGELRRLLATLRKLARPGALLILRSFARPPVPESLNALAEAASAGAAGSFHAFKFRLAMALQSCPEEGVALDAIWQLWRKLEIGIEGLAWRCCWPADVVSTIDLFHGKQVRLSFPTLDELTAALAADGVSLLDRYIPRYEMGERCPILVGRL
jgi:hypothetical protein